MPFISQAKQNREIKGRKYQYYTNCNWQTVLEKNATGSSLNVRARKLWLQSITQY